MEPRPQTRPSLLFIGGLLLVLLYASFYIVRPFLGAVVLAILVGFLMQPLQARLVKLVRNATLAATIGLLIFSALLVLPLWFIVTELANDAAAMAAYLENPWRIEVMVRERLASFGIEREEGENLVRRGLAAVASGVEAIAAATLGKAVEIVAGLILFFFLLFFVIRDWHVFAETTRGLMPLHPRARDHLFELVAVRTRSIALGTVLVSVAQGVAAGIGWWIFGFPSPIFWGFVMTIIAILPLGAPFLILVPAGLYALIQGDVFAGVGLLVWAGGVVGLIDNFLRPYVVGRQSDVHPALILVGTIGGLAAFGVSGFLLGPLLLSLLEPAFVVWLEEREAIAGDLRT